ncbi:MAG TPA: UDP-2,4-diacetamido-2,4,6-trideoxy-beta-L-altropyranose hydrolase [Steroidobacteraceae bacterium]|jgi:UDP-2,4-diacetamido-2,4,6-trideoxy-beta-L-altropyranose hydrolase|nr:UDP-2,4-diacetamido-2,4,6-trideoxy-beta-L-altropyranose hydrolase [Steroidobacteraceae bacterium]
MRVVFRADASVRLGAGHVRRCLVLAAQLAARGGSVTFVCSEAPGNMLAQIEARGFTAASLPDGLDWLRDAQLTQAAISGTAAVPGWLVVDHYGLDARWETAVRTRGQHLMAIDDLADRPHDCDLLLDQNLANPRHARYAQLLPATTRRLLGPRYALVAPEFARCRTAALVRRGGQLQRVLISMGGSDPRNDTGTAVDGVHRSRASGAAVDVVIGAANPHRERLAAQCAGLAGCTVHVQTERMAELMSRADLAVTAGGSTTWERCVLGLPALAVAQSEDQLPIAQAVAQAGAHRLLGRSEEVRPTDYAAALDQMSAQMLTEMSAAAATLCDGQGAERVAGLLGSWERA